MMDYYGQFDMPGIAERKESLQGFLNQLILQDSSIKKIGKKEIDELLTEIVYKTPKYSLTGYSVFGQSDERNRLIDALTLLKK